MIDKLQILYPAIPEDTLEIIVDDAMEYAIDYCNLEEYDPKLDNIILRMAREDLNRMYAEGFTSEATGGNSVSYNEDYSPTVYKRLNQHKRIRISKGVEDVVE